MAQDFENAEKLGEEGPYEDFADHLKTVITANKQMLPKGDDTGKRAQHPKAHATVDATFEVLPIPETDKDLRVGIFAAPSATPHRAQIRFSNSRHNEDNPDKGDAHGMAIKVFDIARGEVRFQPDPDNTDTFDFILMNNEFFFEAGVAEYARINDLAGEQVNMTRNWRDVGVGIFNFARFVIERKIIDPELGKLIDATSDQFPESPVTETYFSTTPYLLGPDRAVKYIARPDPGNIVSDIPKSATFLGERLRDALAQGDQVFTLHVQVKEPCDSIEDVTKVWTGAREVPVARITIPGTGRLGDTAWRDLRRNREAASYNIWNVTRDHRPLGGINRLRRKVYAELHKTRMNPDDPVYK